MSGSGGGGTPSSPKSPCDEIEIETHLSSPKPAALKGVAVGDVFDVQLKATGKTSYVVVTRKGVEVGGLASQRALQLRDCMEKGHTYRAELTSVAGGIYSVAVTST